MTCILLFLPGQPKLHTELQRLQRVSSFTSSGIKRAKPERCCNVDALLAAQPLNHCGNRASSGDLWAQEGSERGNVATPSAKETKKKRLFECSSAECKTAQFYFSPTRLETKLEVRPWVTPPLHAAMETKADKRRRKNIFSFVTLGVIAGLGGQSPFSTTITPQFNGSFSVWANRPAEVPL